MRLAIFDLDNTLLGGDSDYAWGEFMIEQGLADAVEHQRQNDYFYEQYKLGRLDMEAYVAFALGPVARWEARPNWPRCTSASCAKRSRRCGCPPPTPCSSAIAPRATT